MSLLKKIFCLIGNYLPPKLNCLFYKLSGVRLNLNKVWIGNRSYLDTNFPGLISINDNVCISSEVTIICHFDPTRSIKNHPIKKYKKKVVIEENVFIGPKSVIMPGVIIRKNTFVRAGTVITRSTKPFTIVYGNPQKEGKLLNNKLISKINNINKNYLF